MKTKILFSDLDGTLLDDKKNVSREDLASINEMIEKGHRFVVATGRPIYSAKVVAKNLGLYRDGIFLIASNGGVVYDCGSEKIISADTLDMETVDILFKAAWEDGLSVHTYTDDYVVSVRPTKEIEFYCSNILMPHKLLKRIPEDLPKRPPKLIVMSLKEGSRGILEDFERRHAQLIEGKAESVFSNDHLLEYLPVGVTKGKAVKKLCDLLDIPLEDSVAAGDEANDIPMLQTAGCAVVMKNGTDRAKAFADYVSTRTNNESAISEVIRRFILCCLIFPILAVSSLTACGKKDQMTVSNGYIAVDTKALAEAKTADREDQTPEIVVEVSKDSDDTQVSETEVPGTDEEKPQEDKEDPRADENDTQTDAGEVQTDETDNAPVVPGAVETITLSPSWKYADYSKITGGAAQLYRAADARKNVTIGVNAGHGTKGGQSVKTYCHPDMTPKVTGGTTGAGSVTAVAVSGGMSFSDGAREADVTLREAQILRDKLLAKGYDVLMVRDGADVQLDNVARTVIANNTANCLISIHWDGDGLGYDKGCFYISTPDGIKQMEPVASNWQSHEQLGQALIEGLRAGGCKINGGGKMAIDLTQTCYSTIPSVDIELGNQASAHDDRTLQVLADGLVLGIERLYNN